MQNRKTAAARKVDDQIMINVYARVCALALAPYLRYRRRDGGLWLMPTTDGWVPDPAIRQEPSTIDMLIECALAQHCVDQPSWRVRRRVQVRVRGILDEPRQRRRAAGPMTASSTGG